MYEQPFLTLPEELLLACAHPRTRVIKRPLSFYHALSGAVLAELELHGAITIENGMVVELRPLTIGDPVIDSIFETLVDDVRPTWLARLPGYPPEPGPDLPDGLVPRLRAAFRLPSVNSRATMPVIAWIKLLSHSRDIEPRYLKAMETRGLLDAHRRRILGLVPFTSWTISSAEHARAAARIEQAVQAVTHGAGFGSPSKRTEYLVALLGAADLGTRLYPGREHRHTVSRISQVTGRHPIAVALSKARDSERSNNW